MAFLGTKTTASKPQNARITAAPWGEHTSFVFDRSGAISALIKVEGVSKPYARCALYCSRTNLLVAAKKADSSGAVSFDQLDKSDLYYVVVTASGSYNAIVYDKLTPV